MVYRYVWARLRMQKVVYLPMIKRKVKMRITDETQSKLTDNNEGKDGFQPVFIGCSLGQHCDAHQINASQPMIGSLILGFDLAAANSFTQGCSMYDIDRGIRSCSSLFFLVVDRCPLQFALWMSNLTLLCNTHFLPTEIIYLSSKKQCCYPNPRKEEPGSLPNAL
ncbi:uncharacterized protein RHIMIDRAFT_263770 [Rhizopus microsporus ATCC 52813]|uniref:Uncharacterized protein n=1 Tax=Rhizopus microsporus ATCC 52813 TaxID=1340429 RepID=A0A2G4SJV6_RHIZD|nr:uncharacterized protein RHIMIDRAFT_263770 [Rhizopus microsporus ATCC 52813]PHZ09032.1 hypothetical protein RHIMIDRAFT_263770 [Rhizopus microsporus ATCC 52813]